jgi:hypothetical protein
LICPCSSLLIAAFGWSQIFGGFFLGLLFVFHHRRLLPLNKLKYQQEFKVFVEDNGRNTFTF